MTTLYLDTEFNGFGGALISIGLHDPDGLDFYGIVGGLPIGDIDPWVAKHVIPKLGAETWVVVPYKLLQRRVSDYLARKPKPLNIVADWPADFEHLFALLNTGAPWRVDVPLTAVLLSTDAVDLKSETPHNALSDARALANWHRQTWRETSSPETRLVLNPQE